MILPKDEKSVYAMDQKLEIFYNQAKRLYQEIHALDKNADETTDRHAYKWELCGLEQCMTGLRNEREKLAAHLGKLLLGLL